MKHNEGINNLLLLIKNNPTVANFHQILKNINNELKNPEKTQLQTEPQIKVKITFTKDIEFINELEKNQLINNFQNFLNSKELFANISKPVIKFSSGDTIILKNEKVLELKSEYDLAKYKLNNKKYKLVDLVNICHAFSPSIDKLMKGNLNNNENTWESFISKNGSKTETWSSAVDLMGHMALLRNIRNFIEHDVNESLYIDKLLNGVKQGQQLPFRYYSAYNAVSNSNKQASGKILDTIEQCLEISLENLPVFNGNVISLCDNSGSAQNTTTSDMGTVKISDIANLTGVITGKKSENGYVGVFGDNLEIMPIRKTSSTFDQVKQMNALAENIGQGTEHGIWLFFEKALEEKQHWDHIFIYSDQQAGTGGLYGNPSKYRDYMWKKQRNIDVAALIKEYRQKVNKNVNVYLVQVAGYQDAIAPSYFNKTYLLGGWGEGLLKFAHSVSQK